MSDGDIGHGSSIAGSTTGTISNVTQITIGGRTRDMIDKSSMDSTDKFREYTAGMADDGELNIEANYVAAKATALNTAFQAATSETWTVTILSGGKTWACTGIISAFDVGDPFDDKVTMTFTIKVSGKGTWT